MKKLKYVVLSIILILVCKIEVNATSLSLGLSCPKTTYSGTTIKCTVTSNVGGGMINGINANYSFTNASYQGFSANSSWSVYNSGSNGFALGNLNGSSGGSIGTLTVLINGSTGSTATITLNNIGASDTEYNDVTASSVTSTVSVIEKPVPTTTTAKKVIYLNELSVDGYDIGFKKNTFNYTIDVGYEVSSLNVKATANKEYTIVGAGTVHINEGENSIIIAVVDSTGEKSTYTIKVNRVVKVSNTVNNNIEEINNAFKSNKELIINLEQNKDELKVTREILDTIKGQDRKITYNIKNKNETVYSYTFDGNKFSDSYNDIDLTINTKNTKKEEIIKSLKDEKMIYVENKYKGFFPTGTKIKIKNITGYHQETRMRLYRLNIEETLELIKKDIKIKDKYMEIELEKGGTYVLSNNSTSSQNTNKGLIVISVIIFIEILVVAFLIFRKKNEVEIPKLNGYINNSETTTDNNIEKLDI